MPVAEPAVEPAAEPAAAESMIAARDLRKSYGSLRAVDGVSFEGAGHGLKLPSGFRDTHLARIGPDRPGD